MKRTLSLLFVAVVALFSLLGTASAEPDVTAGPDVLINSSTAAPVTVHPDASIQALSCGAGDLCVWPVANGSEKRCSWSNKDDDWQKGSVTCSWSSSRAVWAVYNRGVDKDFAGVCLYANAGFDNWEIWVARGTSVGGLPGVKIRSHRWVSGTTC